MLSTVRAAICVAAAATALLAAAHPAVGQVATPDATRPVRRVAVLDFTNSALRDNAEFEPARRGLSALLVTELLAYPQLELVERGRLDEVLSEIDLGTSGRVSPDAAARVGRVLGAGHVIVGSFLIDRTGQVRMDARVVRVETSRIVHATSVIGESGELLDVATRLGTELGSVLSSTPTDPERGGDTAVGQPTGRTKVRLDLLYTRGLLAEDRGEAAEAVRYFTRFLKEAPAVYRPDLRAHIRDRVAVLSLLVVSPEPPV